MDRNAVSHAVEKTVGPCRRCQYCTGDIAVHRRGCELAGLSTVSVQPLYALDIKPKDSSPVSKQKSQSSGYAHKIKIYLLSGFMGAIPKPLFMGS